MAKKTPIKKTKKIQRVTNAAKNIEARVKKTLKRMIKKKQNFNCKIAIISINGSIKKEKKHCYSKRKSYH